MRTRLHFLYSFVFYQQIAQHLLRIKCWYKIDLNTAKRFCDTSSFQNVPDETMAPRVSFFIHEDDYLACALALDIPTGIRRIAGAGNWRQL
jgi:hypothetical protein